MWWRASISSKTTEKPKWMPFLFHFCYNSFRNTHFLSLSQGPLPLRIDHQLILFPLFTSPKFVDWSFSRQIEWRHGYQPLPISALSSSRNVQRFWFGITYFLDSHHHLLKIPTLCKKFSLWARPIVGVTAGSDMDLPNYLNHISFSQVLLFDFWICLISHTIFPFNWFLLLDFLIIPIIHHLKGVLFLALDNYPNQIFFFGFSY